MRVVADSHAIVWYVQGSPRLGADATQALTDAEASDGIVVSVATLVDLWYVTQTTRGVSTNDLARVRATLESSPKIDLHEINVAVVDAAIVIPREVLSDPWDRFITATARALDVALVTRDERIRDARLVETIW